MVAAHSTATNSALNRTKSKTVISLPKKESSRNTFSQKRMCSRIALKLHTRAVVKFGFGSRRFGFGDDFSPMVFGFGALKPFGFGFGFGFPPVDIQWISEINHLELKLMFYNILIIICLLRLLNLFKVDS